MSEFSGFSVSHYHTITKDNVSKIANLLDTEYLSFLTNKHLFNQSQFVPIYMNGFLRQHFSCFPSHVCDMQNICLSFDNKPFVELSWVIKKNYSRLLLTQLCITQYYHLSRPDGPVPVFSPMYNCNSTTFISTMAKSIKLINWSH